jgi:Ca2+-transporting ATPase
VTTARALPEVPGGPEAPWHTRAAVAVVKELGTDVQAGLPDAEAARRLALDGPNTLLGGRRRGPFRTFLAQFADFMVMVLLAAAAVAGAIGELRDAVAILAIVLLNAIFGFLHEHRTERALAMLKALAAPQARVRRSAATRTAAASTLVAGDVVVLEAGNVVPADLRLVEVVRLRVDEAALTGESHPVEKGTEPADGEDLPLGDRRCMAYSGTVVTYGRGLGVVVETGMRTELGRVARLLHETREPRTPLQRRLDRMARWLALAVLALCAVIFATGLLRGVEPVLMFLTALSLAVAAMPEALPAVVTASLALGAQRMARRHALIRRLPAVETLGSVTVICADKTGTLTGNRMRVQVIRAAGAPEGEPPPSLLAALALSNDAERGPDGRVHGDPTEVALFEAAAERGVEKAGLERAMPLLAQLPFSSERGMMTTLHRDGDGIVAFTKGSPERVLARCALARGDSPLDPVAALAAAMAMAEDGLRVLAFASRSYPGMPDGLTAETAERELTFLGLVGLLDPARPEARAALEECRTAGIQVVMISGDHPATAGAVARHLGITSVHARATPEDKIEIVKALQRRGEVVAMTGDGVNDAPALRQADIGVAMGQAGTDVAREAAHMVLLDDNFATIVAAVREGRRIFDNIRKFVRYVLTCNSAEIWTLFLAPLAGLPVPLLPIQILWINVVTDGLPGLALAVEPEEPGVMRRPPRSPAESMFARGLWQHVIWVGLLMGGACLITQAYALHIGSPRWQSMTYTVLALLQLGHLLAIRSEREPFHRGFFSNPPLLWAVGLTVVLQLATLYLPLLNTVLRTDPLTAAELGFCIAVSAVGFLAVEAEKALIRRGRLYRESPAGAGP